jgi:hypothetical protein
MPMFYLDYPVARLRPAPYNPRRIEEPAFLALRESIRTLGMLKPSIIADTGMIVFKGGQNFWAMTRFMALARAGRPHPLSPSPACGRGGTQDLGCAILMRKSETGAHIFCPSLNHGRNGRVVR